MSRHCWTQAELLAHAEHLADHLTKHPPEAISGKVERFAMSLEDSDPVFADWILRSSQRERWEHVIETIRLRVAAGDFGAATLAAQSFEAERDLIARRLNERSARAGNKGRDTRVNANENRNERIRAYFAERAITPRGAERFKLSVRQIRRILSGK